MLQFCLLLLVWSGFLLLLHSVLKDYIIWEMCPFHLGFQISWHIVLCRNFLQCFVFLWYQFFSPLPFLIIFVWVLSLFLMSLIKGLLTLFIFSKNQLLDLLILWIVPLICMSFNSGVILVISFLLLILGFVCCSSISCSCRVRLFIWSVSIFFRYCYELPSGLPSLFTIGIGLCVFIFICFQKLFDFFLDLVVNPFIV